MPEFSEEQLETLSVWKEISGAEDLINIYGYYPTLHDACVVDIQVQFEDKSLYIVFEYCDLVQKPGVEEESECTLIGIRWKDVVKSDLKIDGNDIDDIDFRKIGDFIETKFSLCFGIYGSILARTIEVVRLDGSQREHHTDENRYLYTISFHLTD
jgi:hypothetical protein